MAKTVFSKFAKFYNLHGIGEWKNFFQKQLMDRQVHGLFQAVAEAYGLQTVPMSPRYPQFVFRAFRETPLDRVRVVILGPDPYPNRRQATGLAFDVGPDSRDIPASLQNIYKELLNEGLITAIPAHGDLSRWSSQGVMLLNTVLTSEEENAGAHQGEGILKLVREDLHACGWETFTARALEHIVKVNPEVIIVCWGKAALHNLPESLRDHPHIISTSHPSPLSANKGFFGSGCFQKINDLLLEQGRKPIMWGV